MNLVKQTFAQAMLLCGALDEQQAPLLELFCRSAVAGLKARLREGITPEDCKPDFVAAGALYALAALSETDALAGMERLQIGDVTLVPGGTSAAVRCLRSQADLMISPYCKDNLAFRRV